MIPTLDAVILIGFGGLFALFMVLAGVVIHTRWIDRKLVPPAKPTPTQKLPAVQPPRSGGTVL